MTTRISHLPSRTIRLNHEDYLYFSGTSYLGMGHSSGFKSLLESGVEKYGTIFSASRNNNLQLDIYKSAENYLAEWCTSEAALTVTSGMLAGMLAVKYLNDADFFYVNQAHPAIWKEIPTKYYLSGELRVESGENSQLSTLNSPLSDVYRALAQNKNVVLASNAIDPLYCQTIYFDWIKELPDDARVTVLIDDSHGLGICGEKGGGHFESIKALLAGKNNIRLIVTGSMAKAMGIPGGVILSDKKTIAEMSQSPIFSGASPIVPAYLFAFTRSEGIYSIELDAVRHNIDYFNHNTTDEIKNLLVNEKGYPVYYVKDNSLFDFLYARKIFISSFAYPKPTDAPITRIVLSSLHTEYDIKMLIDALNAFQIAQSEGRRNL